MTQADPKGYYAALGLSPGAASEDIKAAYRTLAKRLHPDMAEGGAIDGTAFARVAEAYRVLGDPVRRLEYDAAAGASGDAPVQCGRCGRVSAQPRFVLYDEVRSWLRDSRRRSVGGILCRDCAEHVALQASAATWLFGWWALRGPAASVQALLLNISGGRMPPDDNLALLLRQAEAFRSKGREAVARAVLDQARIFARDGRQFAAIDALSARVQAEGPQLKDRWRGLGILRSLHLLPAAALLLGALLAATWAGF